MYLTYLNLPKLSEELVQDVYDTIASGSKYTSQGNTDAERYEHFSSIAASKKLRQFTESIFDFRHTTHIFVLSDNLPVHIDNLDVRTIAYNYVIKSGAGSTNIHNEKKELIESYNIDLHRWHILDVSQNHSVLIPDPPRILVTVSPLGE